MMKFAGAAPTENLAYFVWTNRKVWAGPLAIAVLIVTAMFIIASGPVDMPFIYRQLR